MTKHSIFLFLLSLAMASCHPQDNFSSDIQVGGPCQGCEAVHEYDKKELQAVDTLPGYGQHKPPMKVTGTIFQQDGKTPASNVILYIYHTNRKGLYKAEKHAKEWGKVHGMYRGWIKTGPSGTYTFYSFRPAPYPNGQEAEHIHMIVKEPGLQEYYIDNIVFTDDPLLSQRKKDKLSKRAGSGICTPIEENGILMVQRDIILGLNIPDYP
ncbi:MAG: intradiol ring-cleavage dioxygenase [Bacteroidota bacterium]